MPKATIEEQLEATDKEFKTFVEKADKEQLLKKFAEVAKNEVANQSAKKADEDLLRAQESVANASLGYNEVTKANKLRIKYLTRFLADAGDTVAQTIIQNTILADALKG